METRYLQTASISPCFSFSLSRRNVFFSLFKIKIVLMDRYGLKYTNSYSLFSVEFKTDVVNLNQLHYTYSVDIFFLPIVYIVKKYIITDEDDFEKF